MMPDPIEDQLRDLLDDRIVEPVRNLLGDDLAELLAERAESRALLYTQQLLGPDRRIAAQTAIDLAVLLPDEIPAEFWATPLGQAIARTYEVPQTVTVRDAVRILGVSRSRVYRLLDDGKLTAAPGGVELTSVLDRLAEGWVPAHRPGEPT